MDTQDLRRRIHDARVAAGLFEDDMAAQYGLPAEMYRAFEEGRANLAESTIADIVRDLEIDRRGTSASDNGGIEHAELP